MRNKKLFHLLRTLNRQETEDFGDFLSSPYFNKNKKIISLWQLIMAYKPYYNDPDLKDYATYREIYSHTPSVEAAFRSTTLLLKDFLAYNRFKEKEGLYKKHLLMEELLKKKMHKEFNSIYNATLKDIKLSMQHNFTFLPGFLIEFNHVEHLLQTEEKLGKLTSSVSMTLEWLDKFYLSQKLVLSASLLNFKKIKGIELPASEMIEEINRRLMAGWLKDEPSIKVLHLGYRLNLEGNDDDFFALLASLESHAACLSNRQLRDHYTLAANHCIKRIREGEKLYPLLFSIYGTILQHTKEQGEYISSDFLKNVVTVGCRLKNYAKTVKLIKQYKDLVSPEYRTSAYLFNLGIVDFYQKKYQDAIEKFTAAQTHKTIYGIEAQVILLKIYYLTEEVMAFFSLLKSLKERISSSKNIGTQRKMGYKNFCRIIYPMFKLKTNPSYKKSLDSITNMIKKYPSAANLGWLKEQFKQLKDSI